MSAQTARIDGIPAKATPLVDYLRKRVCEDGEIYVKSRVIATEIDLSAKEIGSYMSKLDATETGLSVEAWAYTNGTTWHVTGNGERTCDRQV